MSKSKLNEQNWSQLDFLINNFYEIVEYKRGRGIYGDRIILKRPKNAENIVGEAGRLYEFYYLDANAVKELPRTVYEKILIIERFITSPEDMNKLCSFEKEKIEPSEWALETRKQLNKFKSIDFKVLNDSLLEGYKLLPSSFKALIKKHREQQYFLASSSSFNFITKEYADEQISRL